MLLMTVGSLVALVVVRHCTVRVVCLTIVVFAWSVVVVVVGVTIVLVAWLAVIIVVEVMLARDITNLESSGFR